MRDIDPGFTEGGNDPELDLAVEQELEQERQIKNIIRVELLDELAGRGAEVEDIPRTMSPTDQLPYDLSDPDWHHIDLETAIIATIEAVRGYQLGIENMTLDPRALDTVFEIKYDTQLFLANSRVDDRTVQAMLQVLDEKIPIKLEPEVEAELKQRVIRQHADPMRPPIEPLE